MKNEILNSKILLVTVVQVACLQVGGLRTHEVGELEGDGLVVTRTPGCLQLHAQLVPLDGEELDGHVAVEALGIGPALHAVLVCQLLVHREEGIQLVVVDVPVLEGAGIYHVVYDVEDLKILL